ncbi:response regulator [Nitrososphaera sp. AFS]|uniref:response regulator n=1 Tax=Nitrososphaera sp. AFS TaxID=2301191 RepID=UPI0013922DC1|nr:response regulator [Nitrososphaera sp. AFS]NAL78386.1 response regulator [Nitrososphaera sp. AFS]
MGSKQQQKRILIIDDEEDIADILRMTLEYNGFNTDTYTDPVLAYRNFRGGQYDLVILDIKMPDVDGFNLYQKIRRTDGKVKIIFLTASEYYYEQFRKENGFDEFNQELFLRKPIETEDLVHEIKKLLQFK